MNHTRAVLRRAAAERQMKGNETARDYAIELFLGEIGTLLTEQMLQRLPDALLADLYEDWVRALPHLSAEQRIDALFEDISISKVPFLIHRQRIDKRPEAEPAPPAGNVVSLHTR
jgi:hypothetical protein